jgi:hypothetical protein
MQKLLKSEKQPTHPDQVAGMGIEKLQEKAGGPRAGSGGAVRAASGLRSTDGHAGDATG